ncbi:O-antigen ligase family protein [Paenibacillus sp. sgz500958]|uniref:O-antigen ligase family protein n=1 Tax=Paenibacillus sp. sgz500958 TaxID=3242475 RepID=UPI0036D396BD
MNKTILPVSFYCCAATATAAMITAVFMRGFFFAEDLYAFAAGWFGWCAVYMGYRFISSLIFKSEALLQPVIPRRKTNVAEMLVLCCPFGIAVLYMLHAVEGDVVSMQGTLNECLRWSFYGTFAVLAYKGASSNGSSRIIIAAWHTTGMVLCLSALQSACGGLRIPYAIAYSSSPEVSVSGARLGGLLQYPNTFGAVMAVFLLERLFAVAGDDASSPAGQSYTAALLRLLPLFPYTAALLLSESRGAWLAAACACAAVLPWKRRLLAPLLAAGAAPVAAAALLYRELAAARLAVEPWPGLLSLAGLWAGAALAGLWLARRRQSAAGGGSAAVLLLAALGWTAGVAAVLLHVHARIAGPSPTVTARALFYRDAWRLAAEAPWLGRGGETWRNVYLSAQSHPYVGSQPHSGYLDILLNLGITGWMVAAIMLAAIALWLWGTSPRLLPPFLVIALHGAIDFDWSYGLMWLLLFSLSALAAADASVRDQAEAACHKAASVSYQSATGSLQDNTVTHQEESVFIQTASRRFQTSSITYQTDSVTQRAASVTQQADQESLQVDLVSHQADQVSQHAASVSQQADQVSHQADQVSHQAALLTQQAGQLSHQADQVSYRAVPVTHLSALTYHQADSDAKQQLLIHPWRIAFFSSSMIRGIMVAGSIVLLLSLSTVAWRADVSTTLFRKASESLESDRQITLLQQSLSWNPMSARAAAALAERLNPEQGESLLRYSLHYSPDSPSLHWGMVQIMLKREHEGDALYWIRRSLSLDVYNFRQRTLAVQGLLKLAERRMAVGDRVGAEHSATAGLELLRQYQLLADSDASHQFNDRCFHLTQQAAGLRQRLQSLLPEQRQSLLPTQPQTLLSEQPQT